MAGEWLKLSNEYWWGRRNQILVYLPQTIPHNIQLATNWFIGGGNDEILIIFAENEIE